VEQHKGSWVNLDLGCGLAALSPLLPHQEQGDNWVVGSPSAPLLELAPLALLSFLVSSRHTRRSALRHYYPRGTGGGAGGGLPHAREIAIHPHTRFSLKLVA
jgi:hypothetical protein